MSIYIKKRQGKSTIRIPVKKNPYLIIPILILVSLWFLFVIISSQVVDK